MDRIKDEVYISKQLEEDMEFTRFEFYYLMNLPGTKWLTHADLRGVDLSDVDLSGTAVSNEQLSKARSLKGAIMPDGTKHE